ncbi:MAG: hypothetical protein K6E88_11105 [Lachnospiraceae bacterium]|nr:hypothetical protein [Lachnospiraceae bacterium]
MIYGDYMLQSLADVTNAVREEGHDKKEFKKILALLVTLLMFSSLSGCNPISRALHNRTAGKTETAGKIEASDDFGKKDLIEEMTSGSILTDPTMRKKIHA